MVMMYLALVIVLAVVQFLFRWRASALERAYVRIAGEADALVKKAAVRGGNVNKPDPYNAARQQYELALMVLKRDTTEQRYSRWQGLAERLANWRKALTAYKGKILPYAVGMVDLGAVLFVLSSLGVTAQQVRTLIGL